MTNTAQRIYNQSRKLAANLRRKGVATANPNMGFSDLVDLILDINPTLTGLSLTTSITCTTSKNEVDIDETFTISGTLSATYDDTSETNVDLTGFLQGATVKIYDGETLLGTTITTSSGTYTYTATGTEAGTMSITAEFEGTTDYDDCTSTAVEILVAPTMELESNKSILSFADSETATLTATYSGGTGATVQLCDASDDSVIGTMTDNGDGTYSRSYSSAGVGDIEFYAKCGSVVSEIYGIEDCSRYDKCDTNKISSYTFEEIFNSGITQSLSFDSSDYKVTIPLNASNGSVYHIPLITHSNQKVELSALIKSGTNSGTTNLTADSGFGLVDTVNHKSNMLYLRYINGSNNLGTKRYSKQTNLTSQTHIVNTNLSTNYDNTWLKHTLTVDGLSFTYKITDTSDNTIWEYTNSFDSDLNGKSLSLLTGWNNSIHHIKEIKVKPL